MVAVPLVLNAAWLTDMWWAAIPCVVGAWWWAERSWPWAWLVAVESGAFGCLWSFSYASALAEFQSAQLTVACVWIAMALALAGVSANSRRRDKHQADYPGY